MADISWKQISPSLLTYGKLTGSLELSGSFTTDGHIVPASSASYDLGSEQKPFRDLYLDKTSPIV